MSSNFNTQFFNNTNKVKYEEKKMDGEETRTEIIKILEEALIKYAQKENWSKSESTGDLDQFGLRGEGFETALEALEKCKELLEEFQNRNKVESIAAQQKQMMEQMYVESKQKAVEVEVQETAVQQWLKASTTKKFHEDEQELAADGKDSPF